MTHKTKYLLKMGVYWSILMACITTGIAAWGEGSFSEFYSWKFVAKLVVYFVLGIGVGYFNWRQNEKE
ncbi:MAG: hypothetical protein EOO48_11605 [Flavobacterium sp.]|nr:MAG: hypothetical protein EOO48_11605 [Flavobacterium sp.]